MRASFRSALAGLSGLAIVASTLVVPTAMAVNIAVTDSGDDRTTITVELPAGVDLATSDSVTLVLRDATGAVVDLSGNNVDTFDIGSNTQTLSDSNPSDGIMIVSSVTGDPADGDDISLTFNSALADNTAYVFSYSDSQGNTGAAMINYGTASQVIVTATVVPTLAMNISTTNADLGTLSSSAVVDSTGGSTVTITTNAVGGYSLSASAASSDATDMPLASRNALGTPGTPGFGLYVSAVSTGSAAAGFDGTTASTAVSGSAQEIASHNAPVDSATVDVKYSGGISATTPAGSYNMTTTYTISGSF